MFTSGSFVRNFGRVARIVSVREDGLLVLQAARVGRWIADPAKCQPYA